MNWLVAGVLLGLFLLAWFLLRPSAPRKTDQLDHSKEELADAAIELHRISRRFDLAFTQHELRTDTLKARRELEQELHLLKVLELEDGDKE